MITLCHVTAMAKNRVIGKDNALPWHIPEDLKFFKKATAGKIMIMGRKTFESLPGHLPNRYHIVISRNSTVSDEPDVCFVRSIDEAVAKAQEIIFASASDEKPWPEEVCIVGGGEIYRQTMGITDKILLTVIDQEFEGDALYPEVPENDFILVEQNDRPGPPPFSFRTYVRRRR